MMLDIGVNLLSDFLFLLFGLLVFWLYYIISKRSKLLKFFGISKTKKVSIYFSNLQVLYGGAAGDGEEIYSFHGAAIALEESKAISYLQSLFNYFLPSQLDKPEILSKLLIADIDVKVLTPPYNPNAIETDAAVISLGSPAYNIISKKIQDENKVLAKFEIVETNIPPIAGIATNEDLVYIPHPKVIPSGWTAGTASLLQDANSIPTGTPFKNIDDIPFSEIRKIQQITIPNVAPYQSPYVGFVQRIYDHEKKQSVFYVAGLSDFSTAGCVHYLVSNWAKLFNKYGEQSNFMILLGFDKTDIRINQVIFEKSS